MNRRQQMNAAIFAAALLCGAPVEADAPPVPVPTALEVFQHIVQSNDQFVATANPEHFTPFREQAHPGVVVVACSDSRFQTHTIHDNPDGMLFVVRNIGNQIDQAAGSVAYGVLHMHAPLLLVIGHVRCSAVKAAMGNYADEPLAIRKELDGLHLSTARATSGSADERWLAAIVGNVNQQVENALQEFHAEVSTGKLTVVGAIYDFRNDLKEGTGRLVIVNVNGESNPTKLPDNPLVKAAHATTFVP